MKERSAGPAVRVLHLITGLDTGGAEMMLCKLVGAMDRDRFTNMVYSMTPPGLVANKIRELGVEVNSLEIRQGSPDPRAISRFAAAVRAWKPDLIQTWMYHADFLGGLVGKAMGDIPVIWNIRGSEFHGTYNRINSFLTWSCARMSSRVPRRIISCSDCGRLVHEKLGYDASKTIVIPNGFDLARYQPQADAARYCSDHFGIPTEADVLVVVGRYHPQKDHKTFLEAAAIVRRSFPETHFVLCGDGMTAENATLTAQAAHAGIADRLHLLGRREPDQLTRIMARSILVSSSRFGEGFSNVIGEAMACGATCVVTDVGDSAFIVGDTGVVVQPGSPEGLASGIARVLSMTGEARASLGSAARQRIENEFTIEAIVQRYEAVYLQVYRSDRTGGRELAG